MYAPPSVFNYAATLITTFTTSYTALPNEHSLTINFPTISAPPGSNVLTSSRAPTSLPVLVLTDVVEVVISTNGQILGTKTLEHSPQPLPTQPTSATSSTTDCASPIVPTTFATITGMPTNTLSSSVASPRVSMSAPVSDSGGSTTIMEDKDICTSFNCWSQSQQASIMSIVSLLCLLALGFFILWMMRQKPSCICGRRRFGAVSNASSQYDTESEDLSEEDVRRSGAPALESNGLINVPTTQVHQYPRSRPNSPPNEDPQLYQYHVLYEPNPRPPSGTSFRDWAYPPAAVSGTTIQESSNSNTPDPATRRYSMSSRTPSGRGDMVIRNAPGTVEDSGRV